MNIPSHIVDNWLRAEDIEGFIEAGAPGDEYISEAERIAAALQTLAPEEMTHDHVIAIITLTWMQQFNLDAEELRLRLPGIERIAQQILNFS